MEANSGGSSNNSSDFVRKLYKMLESPQDESVVRWGDQGDSFVVLENEKFTKHILPKHFKHSNFASFVRQLNKYDFHKVRHNNEENGQSPYGAGAWEFKHPDFKANNKDALDNIRRKAPAARKTNTGPEELMVPTQQMDMMNGQLVAMQQQLLQLQERYTELSIQYSVAVQELVGLTKTVVNHEHVMQNVMSFLNNIDAQRRRDSRAMPFPPTGAEGQVETTTHPVPPIEDDSPASPLMHAAKLMSETNADLLLNPRNLEHMNEVAMRMNGTLTTPPPDVLAHRNGARPASRSAPNSATSSGSVRLSELDNVVYPVGVNNGIDPMYSEHIHNIPYPLPAKTAEVSETRPHNDRKKSTTVDPGWIRQPQILLVEDDPTCRRIGGKFLYAFSCSIDSALDGLEAVNKMNAGSKYDLVLMDIIMPNLDGVSATHLIRQFDSTPIVAMTSNIRSDDISMYFQHGMNDVLPKPFTKEGLLHMLEKHLAHLKKPGHGGIDTMVPPPQVQALNPGSSRHSLKEEDSPAKSPATASNWNSPSQVPGVSPVASSATDEYMGGAPGGHPSLYAVQSHIQGSQISPSYNTTSQMQMQQRQASGHRRQISDISGAGQEEREEPLQAVILADPFETRFSPFTLEKPRCLLPLANTPLIEYTFEFLANAGVEEVFVYCGAHKEQVEEYISNSKWCTTSATNSSPFINVETIRSTSRSSGDAMRDLDKRGILKNDFIIVYGDVVSNIPLEGALAAHRARKEADKNSIMTMVLREAEMSHRTNSHGYSPVFVIDPSKDRCIHYEQIRPHEEEERRVNIDPELLTSHQEIEVRTDLIDCGIDICTPDVLALWSDNFDYQAPRRNFLSDVLKDYELNGKTIHTHIVADHYAARVRNLHAYDSVSKDIVSRWSYPLCPDSNLLRGQTYRLQKGNVYQELGVTLARNCVINKRTVIGQGTTIGPGTVISNSTIGRNCSIGKNVTIDGAYLWENVSIGDGTTITKAIIGDEASVGKDCIVEVGALISYAVAIIDGVTVKGTSRITRAKRKRPQDEDIVKGIADENVVGKGGDGFEYVDEEEVDPVEGLAGIGLLYNMANLDLSSESISTLNSVDSEYSVTEVSMADRSRTSSFISTASDEDGTSEENHAKHFHSEAANSVFDQLQRGVDPANIQLELTSLRMSTNASFHQVRRAIAQAFMKQISQLIESGTSAPQAVSGTLKTHKTLIDRSIHDKDHDVKEEQVDFLMCVQKDAVTRKEGDVLLMHMVKELVNLDIIEVEGIEQWWGDSRSVDTSEMGNIRKMTKKLVDYLLEDDDDDDSGEEEESEEEED
ncbi:heat shock transcription factor 2 [Tothia fuscella]|uniref:Mannose-1-phosphate guanyltransferase n=1 Tax=Tothia fuscella TaxID=1048955 RepID=A0A9P4U2Q3_9PEZI|nr:heat shock transcription factor 2 [Tothia fuscella]